ncbi:MAG: hypothetical protein KAV00_17860, partial [Phycisphaerae bacterium]|nr:hypothetical protein [Phycisphaerae bacterium]
MPAEQAGIVYYQVTFANGKVRDLNEPPKVKKAIRRVVRISRFEPEIKGYNVLSTRHPAGKSIRPGRTVKHELIWNGKAWVGPERNRPMPPHPPTKPARDKAIGRAIRKTKAILAILRERLKQHDHAVAQADRKLADAKGDDAKSSAKAGLKKARQSRRETLDTIKQYTRQLGALTDADKHGLRPQRRDSGRISHLRQPPKKCKHGIVHPISQRAVLPHRVQVWKLDSLKGKRTYTASMAHPEAGRFGAFHYVAYADTDKDGRPDKLIARSPLATAQTPGQWTQWTFTTSESTVFVGNAWSEETAGVYCAKTHPTETNWQGMGAEVYVAPFLGVMPGRRWTWQPYLTNIRIYVNQNPDA